MFGDCAIVIESFKHKSQRPDQQNKCNIYVKNIPYQEGQNINELEATLRKKFEQFGVITSMVMKMD
jgi:RNA recognition motif-containing protein